MIWFTSDLHFGCEALVENTRPVFQDVYHHNLHLIDQINRLVGPRDTLVILGDFCKDTPGRYRQQIRSKQIFFVLGNHDKSAKIKRVFGGNVWEQKIVRLASGQKVVCSHHPQAFWDGSHKGWLHVYGHLHYNLEREAMMDKGLPQRRSMDVGVDAAFAKFGEYRPLSEAEVVNELMWREGHDIIPENQRWNRKDYEQES